MKWLYYTAQAWFRVALWYLWPGCARWARENHVSLWQMAWSMRAFRLGHYEVMDDAWIERVSKKPREHRG